MFGGNELKQNYVKTNRVSPDGIVLWLSQFQEIVRRDRDSRENRVLLRSRPPYRRFDLSEGRKVRAP